MPERSLIERYSAVAVALHWLVAIGIIYNLWYGLGFDDLEASHSPLLRPAIDFHKSVGITVIGLVVLRILWKAGHPGPAPMGSLKPWERKLSVGTHHLLYLLMVVVPLAGWLHDSAWKSAAGHPLMLYGTVPWFRLPLFGMLSEPEAPLPGAPAPRLGARRQAASRVPPRGGPPRNPPKGVRRGTRR